MTANEEDVDSIEKRIRKLETELISTGSDIYDICMKRKFINHQIADLKYELRNKDNTDHD